MYETHGNYNSSFKTCDYPSWSQVKMQTLLGRLASCCVAVVVNQACEIMPLLVIPVSIWPNRSTHRKQSLKKSSVHAVHNIHGHGRLQQKHQDLSRSKTCRACATVHVTVTVAATTGTYSPVSWCATRQKYVLNNVVRRLSFCIKVPIRSDANFSLPASFLLCAGSVYTKHVSWKLTLWYLEVEPVWCFLAWKRIVWNEWC